MRELFVYRSLLIMTALGICVLSLLPDIPDVPVRFPHLDKIEHAMAYCVLASLAVLSLRGRHVPVAVLSILICSVYGGLLELLQHYTGRSMDAADLLFDIIGATLGGIVGMLIRRRREL